jgi:hypothetical protein
MRIAGQGTHVLPLRCSCMWARQEDLAVVETGMAVVGIVCSNQWCAQQPACCGWGVCIYMLMEMTLRSDCLTWSFVCLCAQACSLSLCIHCTRCGCECWWPRCLPQLNLILLRSSSLPDCLLPALTKFLVLHLTSVLAWVHL